MNTADVLKPTGGDNDPGLKLTIYFARLADILTMPTVAASPTTYAERVTITGDVVFKSTKCFKKIELTVRKSSLDGDGAGERQSKSHVNMAEFYLAHVTASVLGMIEEHKNDDLIFVVPQLDGVNRLLGSEALPATIEGWEVRGGKDVSDPKYVMFRVEAVGRIAPFYEGDITVTPAA